MDIAIPCPGLPDEHRIALTPVGVRTLTSAGHHVYVEQGAGKGAGFEDNAFIAVGAQIVYSREELYARGELLVTIDGVPESALQLIRPGQIICGYLHLAVMPRRTLAALAAVGVSTISYELIQRDDGSMPVLLPMSEICGRLLPQISAHLLETPSGGRGILLAPIPSIPSAEVVILGAGAVGTNAAYGFSAWGVQTTVLDHSIDRLRRCEQICRGRITTRLSTEDSIEHVLPFADVVIGAIHVPGGRTPRLISTALVKTMKPRSIIIDVAIDQGGSVETSRPTTHREPTYLAFGVLHYAVPNIPSAVARTAAHALNNALHPYIREIADVGIDRIVAHDSALSRAVGLMRGAPATLAVAAALNGAQAPTEETL